MKDEIVSFDVAVLAKKVGFDIETLYFYTKPNSKMFGIDEKGRSYSIKNISKKLYNCGDYATLNEKNVYYAPTQSLLQRYLREVHNCHIYVEPWWDTEDTDIEDKPEYVAWVVYKHLDEDELPVYYNTYEEALETGLLEALEWIKSESLD